MNQGTKTLLLWVVVFIVILLVWQALSGRSGTIDELTFSEFMDKVETGQVNEITIKGNKIEGRYTDGQKGFKTVAAPYDDMIGILRSSRVNMPSRRSQLPQIMPRFCRDWPIDSSRAPPPSSSTMSTWPLLSFLNSK